MIHRLISKLQSICTQLCQNYICHRDSPSCSTTQLAQACHTCLTTLDYTASVFRNKVIQGLQQLEMQSPHSTTVVAYISHFWWNRWRLSYFSIETKNNRTCLMYYRPLSNMLIVKMLQNAILHLHSFPQNNGTNTGSVKGAFVLRIRNSLSLPQTK
jgi:hypothetical protein